MITYEYINQSVIDLRNCSKFIKEKYNLCQKLMIPSSRLLKGFIVLIDAKSNKKQQHGSCISFSSWRYQLVLVWPRWILFTKPFTILLLTRSILCLCLTLHVVSHSVPVFLRDGSGDGGNFSKSSWGINLALWWFPFGNSIICHLRNSSSCWVQNIFLRIF